MQKAQSKIKGLPDLCRWSSREGRVQHLEGSSVSRLSAGACVHSTQHANEIHTVIQLVDCLPHPQCPVGLHHVYEPSPIPASMPAAVWRTLLALAHTQAPGHRLAFPDATAVYTWHRNPASLLTWSSAASPSATEVSEGSIIVKVMKAWMDGGMGTVLQWSAPVYLHCDMAQNCLILLIMTCTTMLYGAKQDCVLH